LAIITMDEIRTLLQKIGPGRMSNTAYDTAWIARLNEFEPEMANNALRWISENQLADGSWGAAKPMYYHDRVICTLAAMTVLTKRGRRAQDHIQIEKGLRALGNITSNATTQLGADPNGATIGFEMIAPTLVAEAEQLGIIKQQGDRILGKLGRLRAAKMAKLAGRKINRMMTPAFSAEMVGLDNQSVLDLDNLQEENGSVAYSPSATAYFATRLKPGNPQALAYLHHWVSADGGAPDVDPFDVFEPAWVLWNLRLIPNLDEETLSLCQPHLDLLQKNWDVTTGIAHAIEYGPKDSDDSALVFELLSLFGRQVDIAGVLSYEEAEYFRCFALEANPSISANIHVLGALKAAGYEREHPSVQKVLNFLRATRAPTNSWFDKWHASPYYATSHAIIVTQGYDYQLCHEAAEWLLETQHKDGAWGFYTATAEETAYALQALCIWKRSGGVVPREKIKMGLDWITEASHLPYPPLWIGKALYCPEFVVQSTILSAIQLARQTL
jgi:halimadienyl-diphosphate synthase